METRIKPRLHADWINPEARYIVDRLQKSGFNTYLVGGCVRDLLAGIHPKDYDIATSARPEQVRRLIRGAYIIGRRFQLVLVKRDPHQFEVATFRRNALPEEIENAESPNIDNFFGNPEEDAQRRDFTVNGLLYDPIKDELIDYVGGVNDINQGLIRMIGDPVARLKQDPIRILRALRLSHKLRFSIDEKLRLAIENHSEELVLSILPRKREEYFKLLRLDNPALVFKELHDLNILKHILPTLSHLWDQPESAEIFSHFLERTHEIVSNSLDTTELMLPIMLALNEILKLGKSENSDVLKIVDNLFKNEWGLFKTEQQSLMDSIENLNELEDLEAILKRGPRRQKSFFNRENVDLALSMAKANFTLSGSQWIKISQIMKNKITEES